MKSSVNVLILLAVVTVLFSSCAKQIDEVKTEAVTTQTSTAEQTEKPTEKEATAQPTTQAETSTSKPETSTSKPETSTSVPETEKTAPATEKTTVPSVPPTTSQSSTSAPPVSVTVDALTVIADETKNSGHYNNNINAYYSGNVLVCGDYALEYFSLSSSGSDSYASAVNAFALKYPSLDISCMIVPKSASFCAPQGYSDMYNNHLAFVNATYSKITGNVKTPECLTLFNEHRGEYMFYRTDHHWTSLGAYYASVAYCRANGITPRELTDYKTVVNTGYVGSLYSFCASPKPACLQSNPDYTVGHLPNVQYSMSYINMNGQQKTGAVIDTSAKSYAGMFMCGDEPFADITTSAGTGKKLLVFKESYGNGFVPFMIDYFDEIIVIDIRHFAGSTDEVISKYGITHALIINNLQSTESLISQLKTRLAS